MPYDEDEDVEVKYVLLSEYELLRDRISALEGDYELLLEIHNEHEEALKFYGSKKAWDSDEVRIDHGDKARVLLNNNCI